MASRQKVIAEWSSAGGDEHRVVRFLTDADELRFAVEVREWDAMGEPYWNGQRILTDTPPHTRELSFALCRLLDHGAA